jgi:putative transposase
VARLKSIGIREHMASLISRRTLSVLAQYAGMTRRRRKVDPVALFWTIVLGFTTGRQRTLAGLRRSFERSTGVRLVPSAFYDRFTPELARFFRLVVEELLNGVETSQAQLRGTLRSFRDVLLTDSTLVRLHDLLEKRFPACRTNHTRASAKLHVVMSVTGRGLRSVKLTSGRQHDGPVFTVGHWVKDALLLFDLGYYRYQLFDRIDRQGGYFISRLKDNANPLITAVVRNDAVGGLPLVGQRLQDVIRRLRRETLDLMIQVEFRRRAYSGGRSGAVRELRLVGVRDDATGCYHLYVTNIPAHRLSATEVAAVYGARWQIELMFKEMKSCYRLDDMPSRKAHVVETLLLASVVTMLASRTLLRAVREKLSSARGQVPEGRWAAVFAAAAPHVLNLLLAPARLARAVARWLEAMLLHEALDPNVSRQLLLTRIQNGVAW